MIDQEPKGMLIVDPHNKLHFMNQQMKQWTEKDYLHRLLLMPM